LQAAILLAKIKIFDWELKKRNIIAQTYIKHLKGYYKVPFIPKKTQTAWAQFTLQTKNRNKVITFLKEKNIPTAIYYPIPMHLQPAYKIYNNTSINLINSEELSKNVFSIPVHPYLEESQKEYIIDSLKSAVKYAK